MAGGGPATAVGVVSVPVVGSGGSRGARLCGVRRVAAGGGSMVRGLPSAATGGSRAVLGRRLAEGIETRRQD